MTSSQELVGRYAEIKALNRALVSDKSEMIAVIGRRRVGKTFLIRQHFKSKIDFELTGIQDGTLAEQLQNFVFQFFEYASHTQSIKTPESWLEAFYLLRKHLEKRRVKRKKIIFIDELPWIATPRSGFIKALDNFWNSWATKHNIVLVICGSAATWMIKKIIYNKGGLHNRVTDVIRLQPFTLAETADYFKKKKVKLNRNQILELYMAIGGIPLYLDKIEPGKTAAQNIDSLCFQKDGFLRDEFEKLYSSVYSSPEFHVKIIRSLSSKWQGLTRKEIAQQSKLPDGGRISRILDELDSAGFISSYIPFDKKKKGKLYRLTDEYSLFYIKFIKPSTPSKQQWLKISQTQKWKSWSGYAFESICIKHADLIQQELGISGIYTEYGSFYSKGSSQQKGFQIDLLIDRSDNAINICEMKFYAGTFSISKSYANALREKRIRFIEKTKTKKQVFITMISSYGINANKHSVGLIDHDVQSDILFRKL